MSKKMTEPMSGNVSAPKQDADMMPPTTTSRTEQLPTQITVKIHSLPTDGSVLARASINLNGVFAIRGIRVVNGEKGPFVSMPCYRSGDEYRDVCFPVTKEFREQLNAAVMDAYQQELSQVVSRGQENHYKEPSAPEMSM